MGLGESRLVSSGELRSESAASDLSADGGATRGEVLRAAVAHMERYRNAIDAQVNRRMGRSEPPPEIRSEVVRRFRTFCRLASMNIDTARPSLDGLGGNTSIALEESVHHAVVVACECGPPPHVNAALQDMEKQFRSGVRRILEPREGRKPARNRKRRTPNAGRRVRSAIDRIMDTYLALNLDTGTLYDVNPAAEALFGSSADKLIGSRLVDLIAPHQHEAWSSLESRLDAGEQSGPVEIVFSRPNGDFVGVRVTISQHTISGKRMAIFVAREELKDIA